MHLARGERDVVEHGHVREQVVGLEHHADPAAHRPRVDPRVGDLRRPRGRSSPSSTARAGRCSAAASTCRCRRRRSGRPRRARRRRGRRRAARPCRRRPCADPRTLQQGGHRAPALLTPGVAPAEPVGEPGQRHGQRDEEGGRHEVRREVEVEVGVVRAPCRSASTRPTVATSAVSFCSETKSLSSGGTTRRTACGSDDVPHASGRARARAHRRSPPARGAPTRSRSGTPRRRRRRRTAPGRRAPSQNRLLVTPCSRSAGMPKQTRQHHAGSSARRGTGRCRRPRAPAPGTAPATSCSAPPRPARPSSRISGSATRNSRTLSQNARAIAGKRRLRVVPGRRTSPARAASPGEVRRRRAEQPEHHDGGDASRPASSRASSRRRTASPLDAAGRSASSRAQSRSLKHGYVDHVGQPLLLDVGQRAGLLQRGERLVDAGDQLAALLEQQPELLLLAGVGLELADDRGLAGSRPR